MKAIYYGDDHGDKSTSSTSRRPPPRRTKHRHGLIEAVAEMDDELTHKYLEGEELDPSTSSSTACALAR